MKYAIKDKETGNINLGIFDSLEEAKKVFTLEILGGILQDEGDEEDFEIVEI